MNRTKIPCRGCGVPYYEHALMGDICYQCMREPVEYRPPTMKDKLILVAILLGVPTAVYMVMEWLWL